MSTFLLFFPDDRAVTTVDRIPDKCKLADVLDGAGVSYVTIIQHGPDNLAGNLLSVRPTLGDGGVQAECGFHADRQTWIRVVDKDKHPTHYLGFETDKRPTPNDLIRPVAVDGEPVVLGGQTWIIPIVLAGKCTLPQTFRYVEDELVMTLKSTYNALRDEAEKIFKGYALKEGALPSYAEMFAFAVNCLKVNYRIGRHEACALELLDTETVVKVAEHAFGFEAYKAEVEAQKKNGHTLKWLMHRMARAGLMPDYSPDYCDVRWFRDSLSSSS